MAQAIPEIVSGSLDPKSIDIKNLDRMILDQLSVTPLISKRELAELLKVPLASLTAQYQALQARNAMQIRPVLNVDKAGRVFVFCKLAINAENLDDILREVSKQREFVTVSSLLGGKYNAFLYFTYGDMPELHHIISDIIMKIEGLAELETSIVSDSLLFKPEYIKYPGQHFQPDVAENARTLSREAGRCGLDELDIAIISELQCNGRKSVRAIAREYDVSPGTIQYRLKYMENSGIIQFVSLIAHQELSLSCFLYLEMRIEPGTAPAITQRLSGKPWLSHLHEVIGTADLIAFVSTQDLQKGQQVVSQIRGLPGVKSVGVEMLIETFKLDPRWGFMSPKS